MGAVKSTNEATLDARFLVISSELGAQRAQNMKVQLQQFDLNDFASKVRVLLRDADEEQLNWARMGLIAKKFIATVPTTDFM